MYRRDDFDSGKERGEEIREFFHMPEVVNYLRRYLYRQIRAEKTARLNNDLQAIVTFKEVK